MCRKRENYVHVNRNFGFALILRLKACAAPLLGSSSDRIGSFQVASRLVSALPLTSVVCFPPPACLAADTCRDGITSERSIHGLGAAAQNLPNRHSTVKS